MSLVFWSNLPFENHGNDYNLAKILLMLDPIHDWNYIV